MPRIDDADAQSALGDLFGAIDKYRTSTGFLELLRFLQRLPHVGPYNGLLLHLQRPGVTYVATARRWQLLGRQVTRVANPLVTLKPFGPVEFVYDIADTAGPDVPADVADPFRTIGKIPENIYEQTCKNVEADAITVATGTFAQQMAGRVTGQMRDRAPAKLSTGTPASLVIELNERLT